MPKINKYQHEECDFLLHVTYFNYLTSILKLKSCEQSFFASKCKSYVAKSPCSALNARAM